MSTRPFSWFEAEAESKKGEVDRLREQTGQDCVSGIDQRILGNVAQANPILHQVEQLINEADQQDREAQEHFNHIERNNNEGQALMADIVENRRFRGELMGNMASLRTWLINLRRELQQKKGEFKEKRRRVF